MRLFCLLIVEAAAAFHAPASPRNNRRLAHQASQVRGVARPARLYDENSENANFLETLALFRRIGAAATLDALLEGLKTRSVDFGRRDDIQWDHEEYRATLCGIATPSRRRSYGSKSRRWRVAPEIWFPHRFYGRRESFV